MTNRPQVGRPCPTPDKVATLANRLPNWTLLVFTVGIVIAGTVQAQAVIAVTPTPATPPATPVAAPTAEGSVQPLAVPLSGAAATIPGGLTKPATPSAIPTKPSGVDLTVAAKGSSAGDPGEPTGGERSDFGLLDSVLGETPATAGIVAPTPVPGTVPSNGDEIQLPPAAPMLTGSDAATETPAAPTPGTAPTPATAPRELPAVPTSPLGEPSIRIVEPTASIPSTIPNMLGPDNAPLLTPGTPESAVAPETVKDTTESGGLVHAVPLPGPRSTPASQPWQGSAAPVSELPATQLPATIVPRQNTFNLTDSASTPAGGPSGTNAASTSISASGGTSAPLSARITDSLLDPTMRSLRDRIRAVAEFHRQRPENAATRSPWGVMHAFLPYGVEAEVTVGDRRMNAIGYCCWNGTCRGMSLFFIDPKGQLGARVGPGYQGHEGQFLAMLAQCRIDPNYEIRIEQNRRTIHDLIAYEQSTCKPKTELTFKLIGLAHYVGTDASWSNETGVWNVERLLAEEMSQPVNGVACGGTHRLMGIAFAVQQRELEGKPLTGAFGRAKQYIVDYHRYTLSLQNRDGTFSTNWFEGRGMDRDLDRKVQTTGHILEWLIYTLPPEHLRDPRIVASVGWLLSTLEQNANYKWEVGPKGHALRALILYDRFVFGGTVGGITTQVARIPADR